MDRLLARKTLAFAVAVAIVLVAIGGVLYTTQGVNAEEDLGRDPCDSHKHNDRSMNCWVTNSYSKQYRWWGGSASTYSSPRTEVWSKSWGVEICRDHFGNFDWMREKILKNTTYTRASGSGQLHTGCLPHASIISYSFHDAKHVHTHTGSKTYRHPFRITDDRD